MQQMKNYLQYNGQRICYRQYGSPVAPAILLIMGLGLPGGAWPGSLLSALLQEGFQVIVPDNRDCGDSFKFPAETTLRERDVLKAIARTLLGLPVLSFYTLEDMALDMEKVLNHLHIRRAHVVGISMGGMIAQVLATQCPNRVASLVSIASASGNASTGLGSCGAIYSLMRRPESMTKEATREYFRNVFTVLSGEKYKPSEAEMESMLQRASEIKFDVGAMYRQLTAILGSGNRSEQLRRLRVPTLVIHGTEDPLLPWRAGKEVSQLIEGAKLVSIEGMGHQLPEKLMPQFGKMITDHCHANPD